jgi:iron complex outermembrane receptor protein
VPPPEIPDFAPRSLGFMPKSLSASLLKDLPSDMVASLTLQRIQRAPTALELFAHGAHDSPGTFEIGDPNLQIETAKTAEIGLKRTRGDFRFDVKGYYTRYDNFIFRQVTGVLCGEDFASCGLEREFIQTFYAQRDAIFRGAELAWQWDLTPMAGGIFGVDGQYDFIRATFTDGGNVPRIPPMRVGGGAYWRNENWFVRMGILHAFPQYDLGLNETPTAGYNLLKLEISQKRFYQYSPWGPTEITAGLTGDNLLDVDVRNNVLFRKDEILWPGRSIKLFFNAKLGVERPSGTLADARGLRGYSARRYSAPIFKTPIRAWTWAGAYLGLIGGYGFGKSATATSFIDAATGNPLLATETSSKLRGGTFGAQAGYNWTAGPWLAGIESDLQYSDQRAKLTSVCPGAICNPALVGMIADPSVIANFEDGQKLEWFATLRARLGAIVTPGALVYATGGLAVGEIMTAGTISGFGTGVDEEGNPVINPVNAILANHKTKVGWALGGGIEARLVGNWTGKIEYLHLDFGTVSTATSNLLNSTPVAVFFNSRITDQVVRAGLNYKFD